MVVPGDIVFGDLDGVLVIPRDIEVEVLRTAMERVSQEDLVRNAFERDNMSASARVSAILFLCLFAGQAGLIALSPVLVEVASYLGVSTAAAGQLRTISGLAAGLTAAGFKVTVRYSLGSDIEAACGQLVRRNASASPG